MFFQKYKKLNRYKNEVLDLFLIDKHIFSKKSKFNKIEVIKFKKFGRALILDNDIQFTEFDEKIYHSALIDPVFSKNILRDVLIIGGGDGLAAREILKYKFVKKIKIVEIDEEVVKTVKKYFKDIVLDTFENSKVEVIIKDAFYFIKESSEKFDCIVIDLTDFDENFNKKVNIFYTAEFLFSLKKNLKNKKIVIMQAGMDYFLKKIHLDNLINEIKKVYKYVICYKTFIPSFSSLWPFICFSDKKFNINKKI